MTLGYATESRVRRMKKHLLETYQISEKAFAKRHKKNLTKNKYAELDKKIYKLIKKGLVPLEIAIYLNLTRNFVYRETKKNIGR